MLEPRVGAGRPYHAVRALKPLLEPRTVTTLDSGFHLEPLEPRVLLSHTPGLDHVFVMPEGFSATTVAETVELTNTGQGSSASPIEYELFAHYERSGVVPGDVERIAGGSLGANERAEIDVFGGETPLVPPGEPYSLVLRASSDDVLALFSHRDFGITTSQHFVDLADGSASDTSFVLPALARGPDVRSYVVFYNPGDSDASVRIEFEDIETDETLIITQVVGSERRGGVNLAQIPALSRGAYTVTISSSSDLVLAGTRYDIGERAAIIEMAASSTARSGALLSMEFDDAVSQGDAVLNIANTTATDATIGFRAIARHGGPVPGPPSFTVVVPAGDGQRVSLREVGFAPGAGEFSLVYESDTPVTVTAIAERRGQDVYIQPETRAGDTWFFGQSRVVVPRDLEFRAQDVYLFNPGGTAIDVTVRFIFAFGGGTVLEASRTLEPLEVQDIDGRVGSLPLAPDGFDVTRFRVEVIADGPIVAQLEHWAVLRGSSESSGRGQPQGDITDLADLLVL